jgi:hypothetical protein
VNGVSSGKKDKPDLERDVIDYVQKGVKTGIAISPLPFAGGIAEVFATVFGPPIEKKRDKLLNEIYSDIRRLESRVEGLTFENLAQNEGFTSTLLHAQRIAMQTHQQEKLEALSNAVINAALPNSPDEDLQLMFINFIDFLTPWHLRILSLVHDPLTVLKQRGIKPPGWIAAGLRSLILLVYPELKVREEFLLQIIRDLFSRGLIRSDSIGTNLSQGAIFESQTTDMGKEFWKFISLPRCLIDE